MKKISLLIMILTFLLIPTCVNANGVSWEDFIDRMEEATGDSNFEENIIASSYYSSFLNHYNNCKGFSVWGDFAFASTSPTQADNTKLWFAFYTGSTSLTSGQFEFLADQANDSKYSLRTLNQTPLYVYDIATNKLSTASSSLSYTLFEYYLSNNTTFSKERFLSELGADYFLDTSLVMAWNMSAKVRYYPNYVNSSSTYSEKVVDLSTIDDSNYPWEDNGNAGGSTSGDTYYNYDFISPMSQPYLFKPSNLSFLGSNSGDGVFGLKILIGDTNKYPINDLFLDLEVYEVSQIYQVKLVNTYKNYFGNYLNAENYISKATGSTDTTYTYNLIDTFNREFLSPYFEDIDTYCFTIKLYDKNYKVLSKIDLVYFGIDNNLNNFESIEDYYNPPYGNGNLNLDSYDFTSILDTTKNFLSSVFGVFVIFPDWLVYLLAFGITVAVILRILGR